MSGFPKVARGVKAELVAFAIHQGPSFIVLLLLLYGGWNVSNYLLTKGIPDHLERIKQGYREIQQSHTENLERVVDAFEREQDRDRQIVEILGQLIESEDVLRDNNELLLDVVAALKELKQKS